jgi:putative peptidoglycan binding protein
MATLVSAVIRAVADGFVKSSGFNSAVLSGIVPDRRHLSQGGYHCSVDDLKAYGNAGDYSNVRADDKGFNPKFGAAIDVTMSKADMIRHYKRVYAVFKDLSDPRRKYFNAVNTWPGVGDAVRLDFVTNKVKRASPDHMWHAHEEMRRRWVSDAKAGRARLSVLKGESKAIWNAREEQGPPAPVTPAKPVTATAVKNAAGSRVLKYVPGQAVLRGDDVAYVQRYIGAAKAGPADGIAGAKFRAAVIWYQKLRGLNADGVVGSATWRAMGVKNSL